MFIYRFSFSNFSPKNQNIQTSRAIKLSAPETFFRAASILARHCLSSVLILPTAAARLRLGSETTGSIASMLLGELAVEGEDAFVGLLSGRIPTLHYPARSGQVGG
jgi:hypothetical protein